MLKGTCSNGKALLEMASVLKNVDSDQLRTHIIGFKYTWEYFSPTHTNIKPIYHLYQLCSQVSVTVYFITVLNYSIYLKG